MSIVFKKRLFREDNSIDFYKSSAEFEEYVNRTYINTGKIISWRNEEYLDDTAQTVEYETIYKDKESFNEALADPTFTADAATLTEYCFLNGIRLIHTSVNSSMLVHDCDPSRLVPADIPSAD
jgi:hypothetical protein